MSNPRPLGDRELYLINLYAYWDMELEPWTFYTKWDVTYEQIALICSRCFPLSGAGFKQVPIIALLVPAISAILP